MQGKPDHGGPTTVYLTRNMRTDYLDRVRMLAIRMDTTVEYALNIALGVGLTLIDKRKKGPHGKA